MSAVDKKLREAHFFLRKMRERVAMAFGDHEEFDFLLSGFLSAGRSLDYRLRHTVLGYAAFRATWDQKKKRGENPRLFLCPIFRIANWKGNCAKF